MTSTSTVVAETSAYHSLMLVMIWICDGHGSTDGFRAAKLSYDVGGVDMSSDLALSQATDLASGCSCPVALKQGRGTDRW